MNEVIRVTGPVEGNGMLAIPVVLTLVFFGAVFFLDLTKDTHDPYGLNYLIQLIQYGVALILSLVAWCVYFAIT